MKRPKYLRQRKRRKKSLDFLMAQPRENIEYYCMNSNPPVSSSARLASIDAYRGLVMFLMMAEVLALNRAAKAIPDSIFWGLLADHQSHVDWMGCSLHDLIQPSFTFLVGVALPFSLASRAARGQSSGTMLAHAAWRALVLVFLGIFLRSIAHPQTYFTFEDTLTQIGLGYFFLFLLGRQTAKVQWCALATILLGYWAAFALYPLPGPDFDWVKAGVAKDWSQNLTGFAAHWNKNTNLAWAFDSWFLNLFPRQQLFTHNGGGYATLSFIPTLGTMILGAIAGAWLRTDMPARQKLELFVLVGFAGLILGLVLNATGVCPNVKRIWTPAWTLFSGGWCFLLLAAFYAVIEMKQCRAWAFPLVVIGMNSIAAYCMDWLFVDFIRGALKRHLGEGFFNFFGAPYQSLFLGAGVLLVLWLILFWMYRRKLFLKI
jgi:predicted acyltransferase